MDLLHSATISTIHGDKNISVFAGNILDINEDIDILTTSAFYGSYSPIPKTLFAALYSVGIDMYELQTDPLIDLREQCNIWISKTIEPATNIKRIGCVEMSPYTPTRTLQQDSITQMLRSLKAYFRMLDIVATMGVKMDTVAMPLLGAGSQRISSDLTMLPILKEYVDFLKRNEAVKHIYFIDLNYERAAQFANLLKSSYSMFKESEILSNRNKKNDQPLAFISYSSKDRNVADNLCFKLESKGIKVWYAPRNVSGPYAESITRAIESSSHFIIILSENSISSEHVLNEIDLAFQKLPNDIKFKPLRIDTFLLNPSFKYYLSRQHWMDANVPPLEKRLDEFVQSILEDL